MRKSVQLAALAVVMIALVGCDAVEQSAQNLAEKAEQAVQDVAKETIEGAVQGLNEQIDGVQQSANELLGKPADEEGNDESQQSEAPANEAVDAKAVET